MNNKHKVLIDKTAYKNKPTNAGTIQNRIFNYPCSVTSREFADKVCAGHSVKVSYLTGKAMETFVSTDIIAFDVDNKENAVSLERAINELEAYGIHIFFANKSYSYTDKMPKFHMFAKLDKVITDLTIAQSIYDWAKEVFPFIDSAISATGMMFGGREELLFDDSAITSLDALLRIVNTQNKQISAKKSASNPYVSTATAKTINHQSINSCTNKLIGDSPTPLEEGSTPWLSTLRELFEVSDFVQNTRFSKLRIDTMDNAIAYLKEINLPELFGLDTGKMCCIFHDDNKPSAGFYIKNGCWRYKCHSDSCGVSLSALDMMAIMVDIRNEYTYTMRLNKGEIIEVCRKVLELLDITIDEDSWRYAQIRKFNKTIEILNHIEEIKENYPKAYRKIKPCDTLLSKIIFKCQECIEYIPAKSYNGAPMFQVSYRHLAELSRASYGTTYDRMQFLKDAGIIEVFTDDEVAELSSVLAHTSKVTAGDRYTINTYAFNGLSEDILADIEAGLIYKFKLGVTNKGISDRQTIACGNKTTGKKKGDTEKVNNDMAVLQKWVKRTVDRKGCYVLADLEAYAKKTLKCNTDYVKRFIAPLNVEFGLTKERANKENIKKYGLPSTATKKAIFVKES